MTLINLSDYREPTLAELRAIEAEGPMLAIDLALVGLEIAELAWEAAYAAVIRAALETIDTPTEGALSA